MEASQTQRKKEPNIVGILRVGYVIHQGSGNAREVLVSERGKPPAEISLTRKTARQYLHMFENREDIEEAFGFPKTIAPESMEQTVKRVQELRKEASGSGLDPKLLEVIITAAVKAALAPAMERIEILERVLMDTETETPPADGEAKSKKDKKDKE